jgi:hypothetical protein
MRLSPKYPFDRLTWRRKMFKVQYKSLFTGEFVDSYLGNFSTERRATNASKALRGYEIRVVKL